ncbi:MAG TPA: hypothetical protein VKA55_03570 [Gammaproteobacteria bacterium]|nr:hypothetical protein [Gammaproteobacteria bacterium]
MDNASLSGPYNFVLLEGEPRFDSASNIDVDSILLSTGKVTANGMTGAVTPDGGS